MAMLGQTDIDANAVVTIKESAEFVRSEPLPRKNLPKGPDSCCLKDGMCYRCGRPHVDGCFEHINVFGNLRVGERYPEVLYDRKTLNLPLCAECAKVEVEPSWGFFVYLQEKAKGWECGDGPSVIRKQQVWSFHRLNNGEDIWSQAIREQERERLARCKASAGMPKCRSSESKQTNSKEVGEERNSRLTNCVLLLFVAGLSVIVTLLTRWCVADELSYVFKDKVTGRITHVEQKEEVRETRRKGRVRHRRYTTEIEHYSYNVAGRNYKGTSTARWSKHKEGEDPRVSIYYNPDKPSESRLFSVWWVFTKVGIGCLLMWMFFWACVSTVRDFILAHADPAVRDKVPGWMFLVALVMVIVALAV